MRANHASRESRHTRAKDDAAPTLVRHGRQAELGEQEGRTTVGPPGGLEVIDANFADVLDTML